MKKISSVISLSFLVILLFVNPVYSSSESVELKPNVESPKIEVPALKHGIPDSKVWEYFSDNWYYNKTSLSKLSNIISVWTYTIVTDIFRKKTIESTNIYDSELSKKYQNYDHYLSLYEIDCKKKREKLNEYMDYDDKGNILDHQIYKNSKWESISHENVLEELYNKICVTQKK